MLKKLINWKSTFAVSVLFLIFLLFQVLRTDFMALPDSGFSRGLYLDQVGVGSDFKDYNADHYFSLSKNDLLYVIANDESGLKISTFNTKIELIDQFILPDFKSSDKLHAYFEGESLIVSRYTSPTRTWNLIHVDLKQKKGILEKSEVIEDSRTLTLSHNFILYGTEEFLKISSPKKTLVLDQPSFLETIAYFEDTKDESHWIAYTEYVDGEYYLNLKHLDKQFNTLLDFKPYYVFGAGGSITPHELSLNVSNGKIRLMSVNTDKKSGVNLCYFIQSSLSDPKNVSSKYFSSYTYSLQPTFYERDKQTKLIIATKTNIGRVEIGSEGTFQNLVTLDEKMDQVLSLTKSTTPAMSPQIHKIGQHYYLTFLQINNGIGKIMLSSDDPYLIEKSQHSDLGENMNLLMTVLTTFLPLSYIGLVVEAYVLTPVLFVVVLISMFWLTWSERNGNKLLALSIGIHIVVKNYFMLNHIFRSPEVFSNLPNFLDSPLKLFGWGALFTFITLYCLYDYSKKHPKTHYLMKYCIFNLIDLLFFTMLYTPYYILV